MILRLPMAALVLATLAPAAHADPVLYRVHPDGSGMQKILTFTGDSVANLALSPDGLHMAYETSGSDWQNIQVKVADLTTGTLTAVAVGYAPSWAQGGTLVYNVNSWQGPVAVGIWALENGERHQLSTADFPWTAACPTAPKYVGRCGPAGGTSPAAQLCEFGLDNHALLTLNQTPPYLDSTYPRYSADCRLVVTGDWGADDQGRHNFYVMAAGQTLQAPIVVNLTGYDQFAYGVSSPLNTVARIAHSRVHETGDQIYLDNFLLRAETALLPNVPGLQIGGVDFDAAGDYVYFAAAGDLR